MNSSNCIDCLCQQCSNLSNLGQDITNEARECCKNITCQKRKEIADYMALLELMRAEQDRKHEVKLKTKEFKDGKSY